jgi:RNA polymerase sigma-70 factor (ECF subfamily)
MSPHFPDTYRDLVRPVRARCRRLLGPTAAVDDIVQETFVRLWHAGPSLTDAGASSLASWVHRTCTRLSIDALRERARCRPAAEDAHDLPARDPTPHDIAAALCSGRSCAASPNGGVAGPPEVVTQGDSP